MLDLADVDINWLAAAIDFEGSLCLFKDKHSHCCRGFSWVPKLQIGNVNKEILNHCKGITKSGAISGGGIYKNHWRPVWYWQVCSNGLRELLPLVLPFLIVKKRHAELLIEALDLLKEHWGNQYHTKLPNDLRLQEIEVEIKSLNMKGRGHNKEC